MPALIVAVLSGTVAAAISLAAGAGWINALIAYWLGGNIGMMAVLVPLLMDISGTAPRPRPRLGFGFASGRAFRAMSLVGAGLLLVFWQVFHGGTGSGEEVHIHDIGALLSLHGDGANGLRYLVATGLPEALSGMMDRLLRIDMWIPGLILYCYGLVRLLVRLMQQVDLAEQV
ncbi:hypothetical protein [Paracoccus marinaquae]|uniref:Uncharacterized protein n=1 Tax=Paracoccus marinaquae TaxID=2841926 RepID=A0ABS6ALN8_9RHOB|nr:hypothetical protein [Paracoccus marinaquae]MBU3031017.1 hypothetical protein [Paracoccus marinaquae]